MQQSEILQDLVSKWISLALEYATGAPDLRALYIYGAREHPGITYVNVLFDQGGLIVYPTHLQGANSSGERASSMQDLFQRDLFAAVDQFKAGGIAAPTEYRVYFEPETRKLDVQLSREVIYGGTDKVPGFHGFLRWLGERAPKLY